MAKLSDEELTAKGGKVVRRGGLVVKGPFGTIPLEEYLKMDRARGAKLVFSPRKRTGRIPPPQTEEQRDD